MTRLQSRSAFAGLGRDAALALATRVHPEVVSHTPWTALRGRAGSGVRYLSAHAAVLPERDGQPGGVLESTWPLRTRGGTGDEVPVDLTLRDVGGAFEPAAPLTPLSIPERLDRSIRLSGLGLGIRPGGDQSVTGTPAGNGVFYSNLAADTDLHVAPRPDGVELSLQLRSAQSPETFTTHVHLPAGASLAPPGQDGSVAIVKGTDRLGLITAPQAWDAENRPIPVSMTAGNGELVIRVAHRAGDWRYPLIVDPAYLDDQRDWQTNSSMRIGYWDPEVGDGTYFGWAIDGGFGRGLYIQSARGIDYPDRTLGEWILYAGSQQWLTDAFIPEAWFDSVTARTQSSCVNEGFYASDGHYLSGWASNLNGQTPVVSCHDLAGVSTHICRSGPDCSPTATGANHIGVLTFTNGAGYRDSIQTYVGGAAVVENDLVPPTVYLYDQAGLPNGPDGWVDSATVTADLHGSDGGVGIQEFSLNAPGNPVQDETSNCDVVATPCFLNHSSNS
jgi:hypothetical protein